MESPITFLKQLIDRGTPLDVVERYVAVFSSTLDENSPWFGIQAANVAVLRQWRGAQGKWICMRQEAAGSYMVGLLMPPDAVRPAARCYYADTTIAELTILLRDMPELHPVSNAEFEEAADVSNYRARLQAYRAANDTPLWRMVQKVATGREANTTVRSSRYLDTHGKCLMCEKEASHIASATIGKDRDASSLMLTLCHEHVQRSGERFLIEFLAQWMGRELPLTIAPVTPDNMSAWAEDAIMALGCTVQKRNPARCEVTGVRPSGFKIILRCEAASEKNSYGYMILDPLGENVRRIDDAHDHPEQPVRWDHRHSALPKENRTVEPSFTFGMPLFDLPAIRQEVELAEAALRSGSST